MRIYILTRGRTENQITLRNLPPALYKVTNLVCYGPDPRIREVPEGVTVIPYPARLQRLGDVRQWVIDNHASKVLGWRNDPHLCLIDDDFSFLKRKPKDQEHFLKAEPEDLVSCFVQMDKLLRTYAEVGLIARSGNNRAAGHKLLLNTRIAGVLGFNYDALDFYKIKFNRIPTMTDFDACLQLLEHGEENAMMCEYSYGQPGSNTEGGCSIYRTMALQKEGAEGLQRLHPDFVRIVEKQTKGSWGGQKRTDVVVSWKKAAEFGKDTRMLRMRNYPSRVWRSR
jgi:hypothetical protein